MYSDVCIYPNAYKSLQNVKPLVGKQWQPSKRDEPLANMATSFKLNCLPFIPSCSITVPQHCVLAATGYWFTDWSTVARSLWHSHTHKKPPSLSGAALLAPLGLCAPTCSGPLLCHWRHYLCVVSFSFSQPTLPRSTETDRASLPLAPVHFSSRARAEPTVPAHKERAANREPPLTSPGQWQRVLY